MLFLLVVFPLFVTIIVPSCSSLVLLDLCIYSLSVLACVWSCYFMSSHFCVLPLPESCLCFMFWTAFVDIEPCLDWMTTSLDCPLNKRLLLLDLLSPVCVRDIDNLTNIF